MPSREPDGTDRAEACAGELAFVEKAFPEHVAGLDLTGKIALAYQDDFWELGDKPVAKLQRVHERGATGMLFAHRRRDDIITCWPLGREPAPIPFVSISFPEFLALRRLMQSAPVEVTVTAQGEVKRGDSPNIWTSIQGTGLPDEAVGVGGSHHETVPFCPGANDNGAGVSMTLELARFFRDNPQKRSVLLLNNGGEEAGCWGTAAFVRQHLDWLKRSLKAMFMVDQMGGSQPVIFAGGTGWVEEIYLEEAKRLGYRLPYSTDKRVVPTPEFIGDPLPFVQAGLPVANIGGWPSDRFYHTEEDTADKVSANQIKAVAEIVASSVMRVASA